MIDPKSNRHFILRIHQLFLFDIRTRYLSPKFELDKMPKALKKSHLKRIDKICPEGSLLVVLEYEAQDEITPSFYSTNYLNAPIEINNEVGGLGLIMGSDDKVEEGLRRRILPLGNVPKDYIGNYEFELIAWSLKE